MEDRYQFSKKAKQVSYVLIGVGLLAVLLGFIIGGGHAEGSHHTGPHARVWASLLVNNLFFLGLALAAAFFLSVSYVANAGWHVLVKRVPEAVMTYIPVVFPLMLIVFLAGGHDLYHWTDEKAVAADEILKGKSGYLNTTFFLLRMLIYFGVWTLITFSMRRLSMREDIEGGLSSFNRRTAYAAIYIVFFAISSSTASWDWIMSIDTHWYSTLYGWYLFATIFVSGMAAITLLVIYLKQSGHLTRVTEEHLHDLGKFVFAFSVFWTYLWFDQFMLIWYANIPEETIYFKMRLDNYKFLFFATFFLNFILPFLVLMTRNSKRSMKILTFVCICVLAGHWFDFYLLVTPGVMGSGGHLGLLEIGITAGYVGLFLYVVLTALSRASLVPRNHPYLEESIHHET